ncbi:type VII secretion protein EccCa [Crossiella cryophila]|uniref:S-DNA-T family DNA segregation ATPase FtsK/SpoIIIE n=1 Tax=Crossiella cryophila TaxID=43355 RepID=A0A7W7CHW2_9PSEU|nr:type VII secretion protein EccCa [Crossiella cryophila]MBB4681420.1 S-DNA-T family DNA segregation ATPase FtsK/SpoIIIE [Crossiella cryophila]
MSVITFRKGQRRPGPEMPEGELSIQEPPTLPEVQRSAGAIMMYLPMALSSTATVLLFVRPGENGAFSYLAAGLMTVSSMAMLIGQLGRSAGERRQKLNDARRDYLRYLAQSRRKVREVVLRQREALAWRHPDPAALWSLPGTSRMWERDAQDEDFGEVRVALGPQRLAWRLNPLSTKPVDDLEPLSAHALRRFIHAYGTVADQPVAVFLPSFARILLRVADQRDEERVRALARSVIAHLAVFHSPAELRIVLLTPPERRADWEWVKWLPHNLHPNETDGAGATRLVVESLSELDTALGEEFASRPAFDPDAVPDRGEPCVMVFVDGVPVPPTARLAGPGYRNTTVLDLSGALSEQDDPQTLRLRIEDGTLKLITVDQHNKEVAGDLGRPDGLGLATASALATRLAPYRMGAPRRSAEPLSADFDLTTLLGIKDIQTHDVAAGWAAPRPGGRLRVPLGVGANGAPIELDIKESAQAGMGPHGMLIGATGSGKSELLRTLVLALALTHSSEILNFVLVDFKGGATFLGLDDLPHTSAVITNLADEAALVGRMREALHGELVRRQELLRKAGNHSSALDYERARAAGAPLDPLPTLFVVVDEFSELLAAHRDFMDLFIMIGRLGRSLGVHLLLASQRLDESRIHQLESHLSYRIGLRTFSAMESRGVLGVPDAYQLPADPGNGFLKNGVGALERFKAAYVSGPHRTARRNVEQAVVAQQIVPFTARFVANREVEPEPTPTPEPEVSTHSLLEVAVDRLRDSGPAAHRVWLPPLDAPSSLDELLPPLEITLEHGLCAADWPGRGGLRVPIGLVDRPFEQTRDPLIVDLSGADGHVAVVGGPQSGKSTTLRTLITALALTHSPAEVQFYCLDFGGGTLSGLQRLPHVGGVTGRLDLDRIHRTIGEVTALLARRERFFTDHAVDSMPAYRRRRAAGEFPGERHGDVFLVVDGWSTIRQDFMDLLPVFAELAARGLNYGIHLMLASGRWSEIAAAVRDLVGTQLELRLGDPVDSVINMRAAATVPKIPGRGLTEKELHFRTALPSLDGVDGEVTEHVATLVDRIATAWTGPAAPPVRMLPPVLAHAELPAPEQDVRIPLGLDDQKLEPLWHDFADSPHLLVVGDVETGKTNLLRLVIDGITRRYTPEEARIITVDYRRGLYEAVPEAHQLGYAVAADSVRELIDGVARAVHTRLPGPDISPARLRARDWWSGPQVFVVIDDYDMVTTSSGNAFQPLFDALAQGNALGLHLVVARGANGIGRGGNDPLLRRLVEVNTPVLLLSCPNSEGLVFGDVRPRTLIPGRAQYATRRGTTLVQTALSAHEAALSAK